MSQISAANAPKKKKQVEEEAPGGAFKNVTVSYIEDKNAHRIMLPVLDGVPMRLDQAIHWLTELKKEDERTVSFEYKFRGWYPLDAMWAVYRSLVATYGFAKVSDFNPGTWWETPPSVLTIETGPNQKTQIPWGPIRVMGLSTDLVPSIALDQGSPVLQLSANVKNGEKYKAVEMVERAEELLATSSIYRGFAVEVDFSIFSPRDFKFDPTRAPKFIDTKIDPAQLILPKLVEGQLSTALWTPIRKADLCRAMKIPLRRSVLLAGPYGVGKTLAARVTASIATENGWTFLYVKDLDQLTQALYFAKKYQPCVIFAEDINRTVSGERDAKMDALLNTMDGIDRKTDEVLTVFTTNELEAIHPAMLRPGRMDAIVVVTPPDSEAVERLVRLYGRDMVRPDEDLKEVGQLLKGQIPAIIGEAVERAKLAAIRDANSDEDLVVRAEHLLIAGHAMLTHAELLKDAPSPKPDIQILGEAIGGMIRDGLAMAAGDAAECAETDHVREHGKESKTDVAKLLLDKAGRPRGNGTVGA